MLPQRISLIVMVAGIPELVAFVLAAVELVVIAFVAWILCCHYFLVSPRSVRVQAASGAWASIGYAWRVGAVSHAIAMGPRQEAFCRVVNGACDVAYAAGLFCDTAETSATMGATDAVDVAGAVAAAFCSGVTATTKSNKQSQTNKQMHK